MRAQRIPVREDAGQAFVHPSPKGREGMEITVDDLTRP